MDIRQLREIARNIRFAVFDVDGVFTDGSLYYDADGEALKVFNVRDGYGIKALQRAGITVAVITGRASPIVDTRMRELGIEHVVKGREDKGKALDELLARCGFTAGQTAYMGDDIPDIAALEKAALALTVRDATPQVLRVAHWRSEHEGGKGAVRDACELILSAQSTGR